MTAVAIEVRPRRARRRRPTVPAEDRLVPFAAASNQLGWSTDSLRGWHDKGVVPAVVSPGGQWSTYASFIAAVLASARPGQPGDIAKVGRDWWAERGITTPDPAVPASTPGPLPNPSPAVTPIAAGEGPAGGERS